MKSLSLCTARNSGFILWLVPTYLYRFIRKLSLWRSVVMCAPILEQMSLITISSCIPCWLLKYVRHAVQIATVPPCFALLLFDLKIVDTEAWFAWCSITYWFACTKDCVTVELGLSGKCLYMSGLIPEPMNCYDDYRLLHYGIGFTNIVARCTKGSADLTRSVLLLTWYDDCDNFDLTAGCGSTSCFSSLSHVNTLVCTNCPKREQLVMENPFYHIA